MARGIVVTLIAGVALTSIQADRIHAQRGLPGVPNLAGKILTVRGPIDPSALGPTLMHEHIFIEFKAPASADGMSAPPADGRPSPPGQGLTNYDEQLAEVMEFKNAGGRTIVDTTNIGLTRNPSLLLRISEASGLNVVMGAGWYMRTLHPPDMGARSVEDLTSILVKDITVGAQGTTIRSGIIGEVGLGAFGAQGPLTDNEVKSVRASARAARITGAPISIHNFASPDEMHRMLDVIAAEGVDLNRVVLSHTGTGNLPVMKRYVDRGVYVEFDYMGTGKGPDSTAALAQAADRIAQNIKTLIDGGLTDRILVAQDICTQPQLKKNGGGGFAYVSNVVMPSLKAKGVSDETIAKILVDNPKRVLTFVAPQPPIG